MPISRLIVAVILAALLCGCAREPSGTDTAERPSNTAEMPAPESTSGASQRPIVTPSNVVTTSPSPASPSWLDSGDDPHLYPDLEAILPPELGGVATTRLSFSPTFDDSGAGSDFCVMYPCPGEMTRLASELGVQLADIALAEAVKMVAPGVVVIALRATGIDGPDLLAARIRAQSADFVFPVEIGGKHLTWTMHGTFLVAYAVEYLYARGSVLFIIRYGPQSQIPDPLPPPTQIEVAQVVEALP